MGDTVLLCQFLARVFVAPPDRDLVQSCRDGSGAGLLASLADDDALRPAVQSMTDALADPRGVDAVTTCLGGAYTLLFSGVAGPDTVSLSASAHLEGRLFGDATARIDAVLAELGVSVADGCREPADHLSIELSVLAELLSRRDVATAQRFCREQLHNWLPIFCDQCCARDPSGFFAGAAMLAAACTGSAHILATRADAA